MDINKKYIIIFGTLILSLIIITGAITYYNEKKEESVYSLLPISEEKEYSIWCHDGDIRYDCSNQEFFEPGESIAIDVNLSQFNNIPYDPYFLCYNTDLQGTVSRQLCFSRPCLFSFLYFDNMVVVEDKNTFTLFKISVYPNAEFEEQDKVTIMDLTGKLTQ